MSELTHIKDDKAQMVDVGQKKSSRRYARARAIVQVPDAVLAALEGNELHTPKGPVFQTAIIAGIMAAKRTGELIPLCHPLGLDHVDVKIWEENGLFIVEAEASLEGKTGVEMEALTAASLSALTIYDMCKAMSHDIVIREVKLMEKSGGKRDFKRG